MRPVELLVGDRVLQAVEHRLSEFQWQVLLGGLMGDSALSPTAKRSWRPPALGSRSEASRVRGLEGVALRQRQRQPVREREGAVFHDVQPLPELAELREAVYVDGKKVLSHDYLKRLTPLSLAIWYMDDASFRHSGEGSAGTHPRWQRSFGDLCRGHGANVA